MEEKKNHLGLRTLTLTHKGSVIAAVIKSSDILISSALDTGHL